jgi:hypothetical protein
MSDSDNVRSRITRHRLVTCPLHLWLKCSSTYPLLYVRFYSPQTTPRFGEEDCLGGGKGPFFAFWIWIQIQIVGYVQFSFLTCGAGDDSDGLPPKTTLLRNVTITSSAVTAHALQRHCTNEHSACFGGGYHRHDQITPRIVFYLLQSYSYAGTMSNISVNSHL